MPLFIDSELIVFDLETTDIEACYRAGTVPEIVEIGAVKVDSSFEIVDKYVTFIRPNRLDLFTPFCEKFTGIKLAQVEKAPTWAEKYKEWLAFTCGDSIRMTSWGASFDFTVLKNAYALLKIPYPHSRVDIDSLSMVMSYSILEGVRVKNWSLSACCERFGITRDMKHRALPDSLDTAALLKEVFSDKTINSNDYSLIELG